MPHSSACMHWRRSKALADISRGIVTLTINPAVDASTSVKKLAPFTKMRCAPARRDPGGGGINVARVLGRLGIAASAIYTAGGATGQLLGALVAREGVQGLMVPVQNETREDLTVFDETTREQFRFVFPGAPLGEIRVAGMPGIDRAHRTAAGVCDRQRQPAGWRTGRFLWQTGAGLQGAQQGHRGHVRPRS